MANNEFTADVIRIANLKRALSESIDGDLVFRDVKIPQGVKLIDLYDKIVNEDFTSLVTALSAHLDNTDETFIAISGFFQSQITNNDIDIAELITNINAISANIDTNYSTDTTLASISGNLQTQIWSNDSDITALSSSIANLDLNFATDASVSSISSNLQTQIWSNDSDISIIPAISSNLQTQIWSNDIEIEKLISMSGDHETRIGFLETAALGISGVIGISDAKYVNIDGDTITGDIEISESNLSITNLAAISGNFLTTNANGQIVNSGTNQKSINSNFLGDKIPIPKDTELLTIFNSNITTMSNPVCTVQSPELYATIIVPTVLNLMNGSFDVEFSSGPPISGYVLNWIAFQTV